MRKLTRPAQYLLRIDDVCPTVHRESWMQLVSLIQELGIQPILAVVPRNEDPQLRHSPDDPHVWEELRVMQAAGAAIGLHGLNHICSNRGRNLIPLHHEVEFSGRSLEQQRTRLRTGVKILRGKGLEPQLWVAPRHGFDRNTLKALKAEGIEWLSDGMARVPFVRGGVRWIPQQLWSPMSKDAGVWTICLHPGPALLDQLKEIRAFLVENCAQFTSFDRIRNEFRVARLDAGEWLYEAIAMSRLRLHHAWKRRFPLLRT